MLAEALEHLVKGIVTHPEDVTVRDKQLRRGSILEAVALRVPSARSSARLLAKVAPASTSLTSTAVAEIPQREARP